MTVTSLLFFVFAALAALVYHFLPVKFRNLWLLLVSAGFVASYSWQFVLVLAFFTLINYWIGLKMQNQPEKSRGWSYFGLVFNLLFLFILKYNNFYLPAFGRLLKTFGLFASDQTIQIVVPIGLSFLMVQAISYILDLRNKRLPAETDPVKFAIYIFYFPKLVSGPIERAKTFLPKLGQPKIVDKELIERSAALILMGLFRKLVIADPLFNLIPADAFTKPGTYSGQFLLGFLLAYSFALYNDFTGYTAIVRGVSLWFGIELSPNFNLPYLSRNFTEFWSRWHITLSNWLRDYIYFPLSRTIAKKTPQYSRFLNLVLPPLVTMLVSGMWHGLTWGMLAWGFLHGLYQIIERLPSMKKSITPLNEQPKWRQWLGTGTTFIFASLAWLPFHTTIPQCLQFLKGLFLWQKPDFWDLRMTLLGREKYSSWDIFHLPSPILMSVLVIAVIFDILQLKGKREEFLLDWPRAAIILFIVVLLVMAILAGFSDQVAPFVYQSF
jgi:D-alanyl-lipoteichoic acid acyltransferase DltB (MBOAT superfamily)